MLVFRVLISVALLAAGAAQAGPVGFSTGWTEQTLSLFGKNRFAFGKGLGMTSDGGVSIAWTRVAQTDWNASAAAWRWRVETSVPATDLRQKGGDDRNLAIYFVFVPGSSAAAMRDATLRQMMRNGDLRVLIYVWGGNHQRGAQFVSPYLRGQGMITTLRQAGTGNFMENVDLTADFARAFGQQRGALVGIAVSGDSDDTDSMINAAIDTMVLK